MMICTKEVQEKCPFSVMCGGPCKVADDSECADFITKVIAGQDAAPVEVSPEEVAYLQQEREAIQEERMLHGLWYQCRLSVPKGRGQTYLVYGCSRCHKHEKKRSLYCPHCGAKMDNAPKEDTHD